MTVKARHIRSIVIVLFIVALLTFGSTISAIGLMNENQSPQASMGTLNGNNSALLQGSDAGSTATGNSVGAMKNISSSLSAENGIRIQGKNSNSATDYSVTFSVTNRATGVEWSVYIYSNLSLSITDLPLYNSLYHVSYGLAFSGSSSTSTITANIPSGTYYYYVGPSSTLTGPYQLSVSGPNSVSITFPTYQTASFSETGLSSGSSWSVYGTASLPDGKMTILSETSTASTISVSVPNGYYDFAYGVGSVVIESYSFLVSGSNISRQVSIPSLYQLTFQESGLASGTSWQIYGQSTTQNSYSMNNFFVLSTNSATTSVEVPSGVYSYQPTANKTSVASSSLIYVAGSSQVISVSFAPFERVVFNGAGYRTGLDWQVSVHSTNGTISSTNYSTSSTLSLELPAGSYTYVAGEGGSNFVNGKFNVTSTSISVTITFPETYLVNISETGLMDGMNWGVSVYNSSHVTVFSNTTSSPYLSVYLPSGKYNYSMSESALSTVLYQMDQTVYSSSSFDLGTSQQSLSIVFPRLTATSFTEDNLKSGITWGVAVRSTSSPTGFSEVFFNTSSTYSNVTAYLINGTFYHSIEESNSYFYPTLATFNVAGVQQTIEYHFPSLYDVTFSITGLKSSTSWSLTVDESNYSIVYTNSTSSGQMVAYLPNASYNYTAVSSSHLTTSSSFSVSGRDLTVTVTIASSYLIQFTETGLPSGTLWYVSINGSYSFSSSSVIQTSEPNGSYIYSIVSSAYAANPSNGTINISGRDVSINVIFRPNEATFSITFLETGLVSGSTWSVTISNSTVSSVHSSIALQEPNGTYTYEINATGYASTPSAGLITVSGSNTTISVTFTVSVPATKYAITFTQNGLTANSKWTISLTNSTNSGKITGNITTRKENIDVYGITYDSSNRYLYASGISTNSSSTNKYPGIVLVISPITNTVITQISVGSLPETSVYDPYNGYIYTTNSLSNNVSVINTATESVVATISVGDEPVGIGYSSVNNNVYVANGASGTVSVISSTSNSILATITLGSSGETLAGVVFDPANGNVYVGGFNGVTQTDSVFVIDSATNSLVATISGAAYFGAYDSLNGYIYFTDNAANTVLVVDGSTNKVVTTIDLPSHSSPVGITYDSYDHNIYVAEQNSSSLTVISSLTNTVVTNLDVTGSPLFPTFIPVNNAVYLSNHAVGGIQIISSYGGKSTVLSSTGSTINFSEPNGTYSYSVESINGYTVSPQSGSLYVQGLAISQSVTFAPVSGYEVTFSQTGLRAGVSWSVTLGATTLTSTSSTITFAETNGSYSYDISNVSGYLLLQSSGILTVSGSSVTKTVTYSEQYSMTFVESDLPSGATWTVTLNGTSESSNTDSITFQELNGTYSFSVNSSTNYTISPASGTVVISGSPVNQSVQFSPLQATLYLTGTITPANGTLYVNGQLVSTVNGAFNITVHPGSYSLKIVASGYKTYYDNLTVASNQTSISPLSINLSKVSPPTPLPLLYIAVISAVIIAVIAASVMIMRTRKNANKKRNK
jgi:YVTN family beta-propeller protein